MKRRFNLLAGLSAAVLLTASSLSLAAEEPKPPMHMHKSDMDHSKNDAEVAADYKSEATQLLEKAESHRKLAKLYQNRGPSKGGGSYANVAKHCEKLAKFYEDAAKEAEAVSTELSKQ